ncbi:MAG: hypothetical protein JXQ83_04220 [Candidatus Glassbacteria bacterium]|nr:hypothetical protein [Candidatus Glassbacteria bacterium]
MLKIQDNPGAGKCEKEFTARPRRLFDAGRELQSPASSPGGKGKSLEKDVKTVIFKARRRMRKKPALPGNLSLPSPDPEHEPR